MARRGSKDSEQRFLVGSREEESKSKPTSLVVLPLVQRRGRAEEEETATADRTCIKVFFPPEKTGLINCDLSREMTVRD
jgi:hypothetical protein